MAKKRKSSDRSGRAEIPHADDRDASRKNIVSYEDVAGSDDEFHLNRDEVLLGEEPETKRRRKILEREQFLEQSDEEVLGYSDEEASDDDANGSNNRSKTSKHANGDGDAQGEEGDGEEYDDDDEDGLGWGTSRADLYGADEIETEEQALEEEAEARRLQKKQLEAMDAADYGFDEDEWTQTGAAREEQSQPRPVVETLPQLQISDGLTADERLKLLRTRYPEFDLLSKDFLRLQQDYTKLQKAAQTPLATIKLRALSAYLGSVAMYFSLLTSTATTQSSAAAFPAADLRNHPLMNDLLECRKFWLEVSTVPESVFANSTSSSGQVNGSLKRTSDAVEEEDATTVSDGALKASRKTKKPKLSRAERHAAAARAADEERRAQRLRDTEADLADLAALTAPSRKISKSRSESKAPLLEESSLGDAVPLSAQEAADKAQRKKSLRFYASQIAQKANKRGAAGRSAGGDDDIPHRERLRDRQARLNAEAEKRGRRDTAAGMDLGGESDEDDHRQATQIRAEGDDEYYDLIATKTHKKKSDKAALADAQRQAALQGGQVIQEEVVGEDGKRRITYAIEKNKGLTPFRKKDVRNPRVKKRKKYEEKKKKLASIKPVYKGGEGRGGYGGELTGIKKGLVKSTKL